MDALRRRGNRWSHVYRQTPAPAMVRCVAGCGDVTVAPFHALLREILVHPQRQFARRSSRGILDCSVRLFYSD
jgi:hypothetical protein